MPSDGRKRLHVIRVRRLRLALGATLLGTTAPVSRKKRRELVEGTNNPVGMPAYYRVVGPQETPRAAPDQRRAQTRGLRWHDVVVTVVAHVDNLAWLARRQLDQPLEEPRIRLRHTPLAGCADVVDRQLQGTQEISRTGRLVPGDTQPKAEFPKPRECGANVKVKIVFIYLLTAASFFTELPLARKIESGAEVLERLGVVSALCRDGAEHRGESVPRHVEPIGPLTPFAGVVEQRFTDVEHHRSDHVLLLRQDRSERVARRRDRAPRSGIKAIDASEANAVLNLRYEVQRSARYNRDMEIDEAKRAARERVWAALDAEAVDPRGAAGRIPSFAGTAAAAERLAALDVWRDARVVKSNPDRAQLPVRDVPAMDDPDTFYALDPERGQATRTSRLPSCRKLG